MNIIVSLLKKVILNLEAPKNAIKALKDFTQLLNIFIQYVIKLSYSNNNHIFFD